MIKIDKLSHLHDARIVDVGYGKNMFSIDLEVVYDVENGVAKLKPAKIVFYSVEDVRMEIYKKIDFGALSEISVKTNVRGKPDVVGPFIRIYLPRGGVDLTILTGDEERHKTTSGLKKFHIASIGGLSFTVEASHWEVEFFD